MDREYHEEMFASEDTHWRLVARRSMLRKILNVYFPGKKQRGVLEAGCGSGGNLRMLQAYGTISALELDEKARGFANGRNICHVKRKPAG
jgi:hypothetical protein